MKTPIDSSTDYRIMLKHAAEDASTTSKKMAECLNELGVPVHPDGSFSLGMLFCAVRTNCNPIRARRVARQSINQSVAKYFGRSAAKKVTPQ